jgi:hypothetical protein
MCADDLMWPVTTFGRVDGSGRAAKTVPHSGQEFAVVAFASSAPIKPLYAQLSFLKAGLRQNARAAAASFCAEPWACDDRPRGCCL